MSGTGTDSVVLLCFALCAMFLFISESCLVISMCNVASTHSDIQRCLFIFFVSSSPGLEGLTLFKYVLE